MKIYFLPSYVQRAPSTRMRVYKIAEFLKSQGQDVEILPYNLSVEEKHKRLAGVKSDDIVYVQKWRTEFNSARYLIEYKTRCRIVFDLDDLTSDPQAVGMIELADALVVGNHFLLDRYDAGIKPVILAPSPVDWKEYPRFTKEYDKLHIGLAKCGMKPMIRPLERIGDVLRNLHIAYDYTLLLAGFNNSGNIVRMERAFPFAKCHQLHTYDGYLKNLVPLLQGCAVGILPFVKRDNGKSGHSTLANLAMGIPTITSPYAEGEYIIEDGVNGFIAEGTGQWFDRVERLFQDPELRQEFRYKGWETIIDRYDVPVIGRKLLEDLESL